MKFLRNLVFATGMVILVSSSVVLAMTKDEAKDMMRNMAEECRKQEGASANDVEAMANETYPTTKEGKCMIHCLQEQWGVTNNGEYQRDAVEGLIGMVAGDDKKKQTEAGEIAEACKNENDPDKCDKAIKIGKCLETEGKKRGWKAPGDE